MRVAVFLNSLGIGGMERAACRWALGLQQRGHSIHVLALRDGPRREELNRAGIGVEIVPAVAGKIAAALRMARTEVIHSHAPGHPHPGDVLGEALALLPNKIPVVQTNVFGRLENPRENAWTDFRLFISWTSGVQAARRSFHKLDTSFFKRASVAVYPLDAEEEPPSAEIASFRHANGVGDDEVLVGRFSRPDPSKWSDLVVDAFRLAARRGTHKMKLLLREPPAEVADVLRQARDRDRFLILAATSNPAALRTTMASCDVVLHTSRIGESFGYGIAEPMGLGRPIIANSTPWQDQAQVELVRHGECGFLASTRTTMAAALQLLAGDAALRSRLGAQAKAHILQLADAGKSLDRLERCLRIAIEGGENPFAAEDARSAQRAATYLDQHQFGHSLQERLALQPLYCRVRFHQLREHFLPRYVARFSSLLPRS